MLPQWVIEKKRDGAELETGEIRRFIEGYTDGSIPDYQMSALAMAIYFQGMSVRETADLTAAMMESGTVIDPDRLPGTKVDKHSTGGIGDKVSIPLAPLAAACGVTVPMISGRGLGITGGTLDKLESIPGYRTGLAESEFIDVLETCGCSLIGQTGEIAPADRKLYALRDVTATVPSIPLIVSSILSKKMAEGIDALVLDVKCGSGAFMKSLDDARDLARALVDIGTAMGRRVTALITDMNQPLGRSVGNALEVRESLEILQGGGPDDARELTVELARLMASAAGIADPSPRAFLRDGSALAVFHRMVACHGGRLDEGLPEAGRKTAFPARKTGYVTRVDAEAIGRASLLLGAGRSKTEDSVDSAVGFSDLKKIGERVETGEPLCMIHSNGHEDEIALAALLTDAFEISGDPAEAPPLIMETVGPCIA
jgi:pyrimidine-nucleoside phosphorylase